MFQQTILRRAAAAVAASVTVLVLSGANTGPITRLTIAPDAEVVPLFGGVALGKFQLRMVAADAYRSHMFITNATGEPLNVALPKAAVGVHVLPQFNGGLLENQNNAFGNGPNGGFNGGQNAASFGGQNNLAQSVGGQFQPSGTGLGNGFPSLPPELAEKIEAHKFGGLAAVPPGKTIQLQLRTVCLNYGRPDPGPSLPYRLVSVEQYSSDPVLAELLESYSPRVDQAVMQAAAWHIAGGLRWERLERLPNRNLAAAGARLFTARDVQTARAWVQAISEQAAGRSARENKAVAARER